MLLAGEQAKGKPEFTSGAGDACDSLCCTGRATKRYRAVEKELSATGCSSCPAGEQAKGKPELTSGAGDACDSLCCIGRATKRYRAVEKVPSTAFEFFLVSGTFCTACAKLTFVTS